MDTSPLLDLDQLLQAIALDTPKQMSIGMNSGNMAGNGGVKVDILVKMVRHPQLPVTEQNALQLAEFERPLLFSMQDVSQKQ